MHCHSDAESMATSTKSLQVSVTILSAEHCAFEEHFFGWSQCGIGFHCRIESVCFAGTNMEFTVSLIT